MICTLTIGLLLGHVGCVPLHVVIAPHGRTHPAKQGSSLLRSSNPADGSSLLRSSEGEKCAAHTFAGSQLRKARSAWSGRHISSRATVETPMDGATVTYAVRDGLLYRNGKVLKNQTAEGQGFADDNVFPEALIWRTLRRFPRAPDADIVLSYGDVETQSSASIQAPVFTFSALTTDASERSPDQGSRPPVIGFPNPYIVDQALTLSETMSVSAYVQARDVPWTLKRSQAFWRGTLTAGNSIASEAVVPKEARVLLMELARGQPEDLNVAYTDIDLKDSWSQEVKKEMLRVYQSAPHTDLADFLKVLPQYKFLVNVDGVTASWRGLQLLSSGGVMLLQAGNRSEFFVEDLQPWVHYVPLKRDLSDLADSLAYLKAHDGLASRIAKSGQEFAYSNLTLPGLECYVLDALNFMSSVSSPLPLAELRSSFGFVAVPEPNAHLQTS